MRWAELLALLRQVAERRPVAGFDVCELAPNEGLPAHSYTAARLVYKLVAYTVALSPS